jgi:response regulator RpfG family c-di-GMP phosphodiesterase
MTESAQTPLPVILIVDDQPENLAVLAGLLNPHYTVRAARSGEQALRAAALSPLPDLALLDIMMPGMGGFEVLAKLRENPETRAIPVIFVTALSSDEDEQKGLDLGAVDYIAKPINPGIVLRRVRTQIELKQVRDTLAKQKDVLEIKVAERTLALKQMLGRLEGAHEQLKKTHFSTLMVIGDLAELRGGYLSEHARHVADLSRQVAQQMGTPASEAQDIFVAALLHDVGKIGFSDALLAKPVSQMSAEELKQYRRHPVIGAEIVGRIPALSGIAEQIRAHHELFDGTGFPDRQVGLHIPLGARIICATSDYEAFKSGGLTDKPMTAKQTCQYLLEHRGSRYDPTVINALEPILSALGKFEIEEIPIKTEHLHAGMRLSRDAKDPEGFLLLAKETLLTPSLIEQLLAVERQTGKKIRLFVYRNPSA